MLKELVANSTNRVMVVAHPDDEVLWGGGLMAMYPGNWTVICCTIPRTDPIRAWKFYDACKVLDAKPRLYPEVEPEPTEELAKYRLKEIVISIINGKYDLIVTHGKHGEYGHLHHISLHEALAPLFHERMLCFGYRKGGEGKFNLDLGTYGMRRKLDALKAYDHLSKSDKGVPKWKALLNRYEKDFDLSRETYDVCG